MFFPSSRHPLFHRPGADRRPENDQGRSLDARLSAVEENVAAPEPAPIMARVVGGAQVSGGQTRLYQWILVTPDGAGGWLDDPDGVGGTESYFPAVERSGNLNVPTGGAVVARLTPGEGGAYFEFDWPASLTPFRITADLGSGKYSAVEQEEVTAGAYSDRPGGISTSLLYEENNVAGIAVNTIVYARPAFGSYPWVSVQKTQDGDDATLHDIQTVAVVGGTGGTFKLTFDDDTTGAAPDPQTTAAIAWNASAATVKAAIEALSNVTTVNVTGAGPWAVEFVDDFKPRGRMRADYSALTGHQEWVFDGSGLLPLTVEEVDGAPSYVGITKLQFDQADGFVVSQPAGGVARIDFVPIARVEEVDGSPSYTFLTIRVPSGENIISQPSAGVVDIAAASVTAGGFVTTHDQTFAGTKSTIGSWVAKIAVGAATETTVYAPGFIVRYPSGPPAGSTNSSTGQVLRTPSEAATLAEPTGGRGVVYWTSSEGGILITNITANGSGNCLITLSGTYNFPVGAGVNISGVLGTTEANGFHTVLTSSGVQFSINVPFVNAYASGGTVSGQVGTCLALEGYDGALQFGSDATTGGLTFYGGLYVGGTATGGAATITIGSSPVTGGTVGNLLTIGAGPVVSSASLASLLTGLGGVTGSF